MSPLVHTVEPGHGRVVLLVIAHADDMTLFIGGTVAAWSAAGWRVIVVRATDDRWDSVGLDEHETTEANRREFAEAARVLGVHQTVELGHHTDVLGDLSEVTLQVHRRNVLRKMGAASLADLVRIAEKLKIPVTHSRRGEREP